MELTKEECMKRFIYNRESGILIWKIMPTNSVKIGQRVGNTCVFHGNTYLQTSLNRKHYLVHRVIWLMVHGEWPKYTIDHIDGDGLNNRIENLRDVPDATNKRNMSKARHNTSGFTGVARHSCGSGWVAQIQVDSKNIYLGYFKELTDAIQARQEANLKYGFHENHGRDKLKHLPPK